MPDCPDPRHHPKDEPEGYAAWDEWAEKKSQTHRQERCKQCQRYLWVKRTEKRDDD